MNEDNNHKNINIEDFLNSEDNSITKDKKIEDVIAKCLDFNDLPEVEKSFILSAVGSINMAHYLVSIVNLENRSRKISPQLMAKIKSLNPISSPPSILKNLIDSENQKNSNNNRNL